MSSIGIDENVLIFTFLLLLDLFLFLITFSIQFILLSSSLQD